MKRSLLAAAMVVVGDGLLMAWHHTPLAPWQTEKWLADMRRGGLLDGWGNSMRKSLFATFLAIGACLATGAQATTFDGGTVEFQYYYDGGVSNYAGSPAAIVTPGHATFSDYFTVTVSGNQIVYDFLSSFTWFRSVTSLNSGGLYITNGSLISSVLGVPAFTSVTLDPSSILGSSGFTSSDVTWNSSNVAVTWANLSFAAGDTVVLDVNDPVVLDVNTVSTVPLPAALPLFATGLGALGLLGWRRKRKNTATIVAA